jgi:hypothetical protein
MKANGNGTMNRTAVSVHPKAAADQASFAQARPPSSDGDGMESALLRKIYEKEASPIGSLPPLEGKKRTTGRTALFIDKLGERLAFERTGTRLYEALLSKHGVPPPVGAGSEAIDRARIEEICADEHQHYLMLVDAMKELGGDPTALTPAANLAGIVTSGLPKVLQDPRTSFNQCLDAMLVVELTDNDCWALLIELARELDQSELADRFEEALASEEQHLATIRELVANRPSP